MVYTAIKTPGVYVNEVSIFPPSVAQVPTAIPGFIGYTEKAEETNGDTLTNKAKKISSMVEFQLYFGGSPKLNFAAAGVELDTNNQVVKANIDQDNYLYNSMQLFFANGGGDCYVISVGSYSDAIVIGDSLSGMAGGLEVLKEVDEPTMIVFPDAVSLGTDMFTLQQLALKQCGELMDRVGVFDIDYADNKTDLFSRVTEFRNAIGMESLKYGAVYAPWLKVGITKNVHYRDIKGKVVKTGSLVVIDLKTLVKGFSATDIINIQNLITDLNDITADNDFIAKTINDALSSPQNINIIPATLPIPFTGDLPSIESAFDIVSQSVNSKVADAETETVAATKHAKVNTAAAELKKLLQQLYNLVLFIDDFGFKSAGFMANKDMVENTYRAIGFSAPFPPPPPAQNSVAPFSTQLKNLVDWNATLSSAGTLAVSDPALGAIVPGVTFQTFNLTAGVINLTLLSTGAATAAGNPGDNDRIKNIKDAVVKFKDLFNFFNDTIKNIQAFGQSLEKTKEDSLLRSWPVYKNIIDSVNKNLTLLPPSGAVAGIYARVDNERGVWKAPANVSVTYASGTAVNITDKLQENLNIDVDAGKSVNAIRVFAGKGTLVWGARTLAGNDNEWRYVPVRRFFNMVEESVKKSTSWVVFEPNDANTWVKVKSMIENYLTLLWRQGALAGSKPEEAFFVEVGLNKTMTFVDILEGRMIVKIGMAAVRPAEFIILEFSHKVQTS